MAGQLDERAAARRQRAELEETVLRAVELYEFSREAQTELISLSENATYRVREGARDAILRVHRSGYVVRQDIASELAWTTMLRRGGFPTAAVIPAESGEAIVTIRSSPLADERHCVMFERLPGTEIVGAEFVERAAEVGRLAAELHLATLAWEPPRWFTRHAWTTETIIGEMPRWGRWQDAFVLGRGQLSLLENAAQAASRRVERLGCAVEDYGLIHADLRPANLLSSSGEISAIDFDDAGWGWYMWELAGYLRGQAAGPALDEAVRRWLSGYRSLRDVSAEAEAAIPAMLVMQRLQGLGWIASHPNTKLARGAGSDYLDSACALADAYLTTETGLDA